MDTIRALETCSSPSSSSSSSINDDDMYDVFFNFRGKDTRKTFTDHLYWTLKDAGIDVFIDNKEPKKGESIPDKVKQAIQGSRIAVVIFSRRYADSRRCLEELVKIMECRTTLGQMVLPIFYYVDPSNVRDQTGLFAKSFQKHENRLHEVKDKEEIILSWRNALREATDLAGFTLNDGYEGVFIRKIIDAINEKLKSTCLNVDTKQVGIDTKLIGNSNRPIGPESSSIPQPKINDIGDNKINKGKWNLKGSFNFSNRYEDRGDNKMNKGNIDEGGTDKGKIDKGKPDKGKIDKGNKGKIDKSETDKGKTRKGNTDKGETRKVETYQGKLDKGKTDKGETRKGETDKGKLDKGETHKGETDKGERETHKGETDKGKIHKVTLS